MGELNDLRCASRVYFERQVQAARFRLDLLLMFRLEAGDEKADVRPFRMDRLRRAQQRVEIVVEFLIARSRQQGDDRLRPRSLSRHETPDPAVAAAIRRNTDGRCSARECDGWVKNGSSNVNGHSARSTS